MTDFCTRTAHRPIPQSREATVSRRRTWCKHGCSGRWLSDKTAQHTSKFAWAEWCTRLVIAEQQRNMPMTRLEEGSDKKEMMEKENGVLMKRKKKERGTQIDESLLLYVSTLRL